MRTIGPITGLFALVAVAMAGTAGHAASFDCAKAASPGEKMVCADPALSKADETMAAAYRALLAATLDPVGVRREQRQWLQGFNRPDTAANLLTGYRSRIAELDRAAKNWRAAQRQFPAAKLGGTCFLTPEADDDERCQVDESGTVAGDASLRYQTQSFFQDKLLTDGGAVIFAVKSPTELTPIVTAFGSTGHFGQPAVVTSNAGTLLVIPGHIEGTGNLNIDQLYRRVDGVWRDVDIDTWLTVLDHRVPKGLAPWKGIYPDYEKMTATTPLWNVKTDGNCCPTGGRADIKLGLKGNTLVIEDVKVTLGAAAADPDN